MDVVILKQPSVFPCQHEFHVTRYLCI